MGWGGRDACAHGTWRGEAWPGRSLAVPLLWPVPVARSSILRCTFTKGPRSRFLSCAPSATICPQNGQVKARIEGANTPALNQQILALTPANADVDDLEVRRPAESTSTHAHTTCVRGQGAGLVLLAHGAVSMSAPPAPCAVVRRA